MQYSNSPATGRRAGDRFAPAGEESRDERVFSRRLDGKRGKRQRDGERDVVALRARSGGAPVSRMRPVDKNRGFHEAAEFGIVGAVLELNCESQLERPLSSPRARQRRAACGRFVIGWNWP